MKIAQYIQRKKQVVEACRWDGEADQDLSAWLDVEWTAADKTLVIEVPQTSLCLHVHIGEWIIKEAPSCYVVMTQDEFCRKYS